MKDKTIKILISSVIVVVLIWAAVSVYNSYQANKIAPVSAPADSSEETAGPQAVVKDFYQTWVDYEPNPLVDKIYQSNPSLTTVFQNRIDEILAGFDQGGFDPVLCAQDKPVSFSVGLPDVVADTARVIVTMDYYGTLKNVAVILKLVDKVWQIDNIACQEGEDTAYQVSPAVANLVGDYLRDNINELSPVEPVLGGTFYVLSISFTGPYSARVEYEDGHIRKTAEVEFQLAAEGVEITSFKL